MAEQVKKRLYMKRCCEAEQPNKAAIQKSNDNASKKRKHHDESDDGATKQKSNNNASMKRKCQLQVFLDNEMSNAIECAIKEAQIYYTGPNILQILSVIRQLCASYVIGSLLVQRRFTNSQNTGFSTQQ